ncbi:MAG: adenylate/guanylate cyclase domain-containing protein [Kiloniellales bacterium]
MNAQQQIFRRPAAILAADAVGYTRLMGLDEDGTFVQQRAHLRELVYPQLHEHSGRLVKSTGDGFLAEFANADDALSCAIDLQFAFRTYNSALPRAQRLNYRMGLNVGEVIIEDDDIYGDAVNITCRLEGLAQPGGIVVSALAYQSLKNRGELGFKELGERQVKNVAAPVRAYSVELPDNGHRPAIRVSAIRAASAADRGPTRGLKAIVTEITDHIPLEKPSIIVLPFANLNRDPEDHYICDAFTQSISIDLSKFRSLLVISSHTAFSYRDTPIRASSLNRELGVRYIVQGSVRRSPSSLRIQMELTDAEQDRVIWADRFDREIANFGAIPDEITRQIVAALALETDAAERRRVAGRRAIKLNAYEAYLRGVQAFSQTSRSRWKQSRALFESATRLDPNFARAWGYLAYSMARGVLSGWLDKTHLDDALHHAITAVQLDPEDYANHWDLAFVCLNTGRFSRAQRHYERALSLNPNDADLLAEMAAMLVYLGEPKDAIQQIRRAMILNPHYPDWYCWNLAWAHFNDRDYENAIAEFLQLDSPAKLANLKIAATYARLNEPALARSALDAFLKEEPGATIGQLQQRLQFRKPEDEAHWLESLRLAGLPE